MEATPDLPGGLLVDTLEGEMLSTDGGQSWREIDCGGFPQHLLDGPGDREYATFTNGGLGTFDPERGCRELELDGLPERQRVREARVWDDEIYGATSTALWRADLAEGRWQPVAGPPDADLYLDFGHGWIQRLFDFGEAGLGVLARDGLWLRDPAGDTWRFVGHDYASPTGLAEHDGALVAARRYLDVRRRTDEGWARVEFSHTDVRRVLGHELLSRDGRLFSLNISPAVYEIDPQAASFEVVWEQPMATPSDTVRIFPHVLPADLRFVDQAVVLSSAGRVEQSYLPGADDAEGSPREPGGGVHIAPSTDGPFEPFGQDFPKTADGWPVSVQSMAVHDDAVWVVTALDGVWRADLDARQWQLAHDGLPVLADAPAAPAQGLAVAQGRLYAYADDAVYVREDERWRQLTSPGFAERMRAHETMRVLGVTADRGTLHAIASDGVYTLDPQTGQDTVFWQPERGWITEGKTLPSGLHVVVAFDGVWRYGH